MAESYNIVTFGKKKENFDIAVSNQLIGSYQNTFKNYINKGSVVFYIVILLFGVLPKLLPNISMMNLVYGETKFTPIDLGWKRLDYSMTPSQ